MFARETIHLNVFVLLKQESIAWFPLSKNEDFDWFL